MKKSIKILSLVLAVTLVLAAIVIGVFAKTALDYKEEAGVYLITGADLEGATVGKTVKADDGTSNATTVLDGTVANRNYLEINLINRKYAEATIVQSPYDGNKYVWVKATAQHTGSDGEPVSSGGYFSSGYKSHDTQKNNNNSDKFT